MKQLCQLVVVILSLLLGAHAHAASCPIAAGANQSAISSAITSCASGNTVTWAGGTSAAPNVYNVTSTITIPNGVSMAAPTVAYSQNPNQTVLINNQTGAGNYSFRCSAGSAAASIKYLSFNGGRPSPDGGGGIYCPAGVSNLAVTNNYFYGNQGNAGSGNWFEDSLLYFDGNSGSPVDSNVTVAWNVFGSSGDCSNLMSNYTYGGLGGNGGFCNGLGIHNGMSGLTAENNIFRYEEQGMKDFENQGECANCVIEANDYNHIHRINFETQANIGGSQPTSMSILWNSIHDQFLPNFGSWGFSAANGCTAGCNTATNENVIINNVQAASAGGGYSPGAIEVWGSNPGSATTQNYNLIQGFWANPLDYSFPGGFVSNNNTFCIAGNVVATSPPPVGTGGGIYFANETENAMPEGPATASGNSFTNTPTCAQTSVTPTISPASGSISGTVTVTFAHSGTNRNANTGIWYTTDGSTPMPGAGTAQYIPSGGQITVTSPATVKAVGMWGAQNQPTSYATGYGYIPSPVVTATYTSGAQYYLSPSGLDSNSGLSTSSPWLSPNHAVNCGDTITAAAGTYSSSNFYNGKWGTVSCPAGNNVAWLQCATFDACKIAATSQQGMYVSASYWGISGWEITDSWAFGNCYYVQGSGSASIHHIIFANDVANQCVGGGFVAFANSSTAKVDYINFIGDIAYGTSTGSEVCASGYSMGFLPPLDALPGTHLYVAGSFAWNNFDPATCASSAATDGEGLIFDTLRQYSFTGQATAANNIFVGNGGRGIEVNNNNTGTPATFVLSHNTSYGNNLQAGQAFPNDNGEFYVNQAFKATITGNLGMTSQGTTGGSPIYVASVNGSNPTTVVQSNWFYSAAGNTTLAVSSGSFAFGVNITGDNPAFANPVIPGQPVCAGLSNVPACAATLIANFKPLATGAMSYGYQPPSTTSITDPLYPSWLCHVVLPPGLVTPGCGGGTAPALTGGFQGNNGSQNALTVGAPEVQQIAYGTYSDSSTATLPDVYGNTPAWSSSNNAVLQVTASGQVSCLAAGTANSLVVSAPGGVAINAWGWSCTGIPGPTITGVSLATTGGAASINYGTTNQVLATCHYSDGSTTSCNAADAHGNVATGWASSNGSVTINSTGLATGAKIGSATLTAVAGGFTNSPAVPLAVTSTATLVSAYVTPATNTLAIGATVQLAGKCHYTTGADQDCTVTDIYGDAVTAWTSATPADATVGNVGSAHPGLATAVAAGSASITATVNGTVTSTPATVTVSSPPTVTLTGVSLATTGGVTGITTAQTNQLIATCTYSDGSTTTCNTIDSHGTTANTWVSTTPAHATANATTGLATGVAAGSTTFTAHAGSFTSPALPLTVINLPAGTYTITISGPVTIQGTVKF